MTPIVNWPQVSAFRLARQHLLDRDPNEKNPGAKLVTVCRNVCGIQSQVMAAAQTALWARIPRLAPEDMRAALYENRTLVKTSCMRQTLHLIPAADFSIYINALRKSRREALWRIMSRFGVAPKEAESMSAAVVAALHSGPMTQLELMEQIVPKAGKKMQKYLELVWSIQIFRPALVEGLICYGPERSKKATFVRVDQWLPKQKEVSATEAQQILMRRYLRAYGPATLQDFSRWSGISMKEVKATHALLAEELMAVQFGGQKGWLFRADEEQLANCSLEHQVVHLLPGFDPYLLGHADKDPIVDSAHYKRVYRNQGWISPVILLNGRVIGIWSSQRRSNRLCLQIEPFEKLPKKIHIKIAEEAARLAIFWDAVLEIGEK